MSETQYRAIVTHSPHSGRSARLTDALTHVQEAGIEVVEKLPISELDGLPAQGRLWQKNGVLRLGKRLIEIDDLDALEALS